MNRCNFIIGLFVFFLFACGDQESTDSAQMSNSDLENEEMIENQKNDTPAINYAIVIHGGAGSLTPEKISDERERMYTRALDTALQIGESALEKGQTAMEVVQKVIVYLENNPLFNSGRGAVLTSKGEAELDASIMDGKGLNAGAVAGVRTIKNPILGARLVMDSTAHVMLAGKGADVYAKESGLEIVDNNYFITDKRRKRYENKMDKHGTVGCVVLDKQGNLAAGTSTGGMNNKKWGRIGDSPIIGAGTYANNESCAVSCTGHGEFFIRRAVAHDVHARMIYGGESLKEACDQTLQSVAELGGTGGIIAVDKAGNVALPFNTNGMFRAYKTKNERVIAMFK